MQQVNSMKELETVVDENENMIVTKNKNKIIVMNMEEYRIKMQKKDIEEHLIKAEDDIDNGRVKDADEVFNEWKEKYGI